MDKDKIELLKRIEIARTHIIEICQEDNMTFESCDRIINECTEVMFLFGALNGLDYNVA